MSKDRIMPEDVRPPKLKRPRASSETDTSLGVQIGQLTKGFDQTEGSVSEAGGQLQDLENRIGEIKKELREADAKLATIATPFWKQRNFLGGATAVLLVVIVYVLSPLWGDRDPALPRFLHGNFLHTDKALASGLRFDMNEASDDKRQMALYPELRTFVNKLVTGDDTARNNLAELVRTKQRDHFHGSAFFVRRMVSLPPPACLARSDPYLAKVLEMVHASDELAQLGQWCQDPQNVREYPLNDDNSLLIPFTASESDDVMVRVSLHASVQRSNGESVLQPLYPIELVELLLGDGEQVELGRTNAESQSIVPLAISGRDVRRHVTLRLTDAGLKSVNEDGQALTLSAVVDVTRH